MTEKSKLVTRETYEKVKAQRDSYRKQFLSCRNTLIMIQDLIADEEVDDGDIG